MATAASLLAGYGVSMQAAYQFVVSNLNTPSTILSVSRQFGITNDMLAEIVGTGIPGVTGAQVKGFFAGKGLDSTDLDPSAQNTVNASTLSTISSTGALSPTNSDHPITNNSTVAVGSNSTTANSTSSTGSSGSSSSNNTGASQTVQINPIQNIGLWNAASGAFNYSMDMANVPSSLQSGITINNFGADDSIHVTNMAYPYPDVHSIDFGFGSDVVITFFTQSTGNGNITITLAGVNPNHLNITSLAQFNALPVGDIFIG